MITIQMRFMDREFKFEGMFYMFYMFFLCLFLIIAISILLSRAVIQGAASSNVPTLLIRYLIRVGLVH